MALLATLSKETGVMSLPIMVRTIFMMAQFFIHLVLIALSAKSDLKEGEGGKEGEILNLCLK